MIKIQKPNETVGCLSALLSITIFIFLIWVFYGIVLYIKPDSVWYKEGIFCTLIVIKLLSE